MGQGKTWTEAQRAARLDKLVSRNRAQNQGGHLYESAEWMRDAYVVRGLSLRGVAAEANCSLRTAVRWLAIHGIDTRTPGTPLGGPRGENHHLWKGGPPACPSCGKVRHRSAKSKGGVCMDCVDRSDEKNANWRGDLIGNPQAHGRVVKLRGKAKSHACQHCGGQARDWAYDHLDPDERSHPEGPYSLKPSHYIPLCPSCHKRFDLAYLQSKRESA